MQVPEKLYKRLVGLSGYPSLPKGLPASYRAFCEVCTINKRWYGVFTGGVVSMCLPAWRPAAVRSAVCGGKSAGLYRRQQAPFAPRPTPYRMGGPSKIFLTFF